METEIAPKLEKIKKRKEVDIIKSEDEEEGMEVVKDPNPSMVYSSFLLSHCSFKMKILTET